jgi:HEAT repeat protein
VAVLSSSKAEQLALLHAWVTQDVPELLQIEGLRQLAWANDPEGVESAIRMLTSGNSAVRATAAQVLAEYGNGERVKAALHRALAHEAQLQPELLWALVELGDTTIIDAAIDEYSTGSFDRVSFLDGSPAFDEHKLSAIVSSARLTELASAGNPKLRALAATGLSRRADPSSADALVRLMYLNQPGEATLRVAPGLLRAGTPKALETLGLALAIADDKRYQQLLEALRDGAGALGLVAALSAPHREGKEQRLASVFQMLHHVDVASGVLAAASANRMLDWLRTKPHPHFKAEVGAMLAEMGDLRALAFLADRLRQDPLKLYSDDNDFDISLKRDDNERVIAARAIADLAVAYPTKVPAIRHKVESALIFWLHDSPVPHSSGLRALARLGTTKHIAAMRSWSNPRVRLPQEGQQPPMPEEWLIAQVALRSVGILKDAPSWQVLLDGLKRRPKDLDVTMESLMQGGLAILGMSLRAVGVGAAEGLSEWGDHRAFQPLLNYVEEPKENEQSRLAACVALAWVAKPDDGSKLVSLILQLKHEDKGALFVRSCLLEGLVARPMHGVSGLLPLLLESTTALDTRHQVARAIGKAGTSSETDAALFRALDDKDLFVDAALALMLGADAATAARAVTVFANKADRAAREELEGLWYRSFDYWSDTDFSEGRISRWVENARAISHLNLGGHFQNWAWVQLQRQFDYLHFDNGPHSLTRPVFRMRLTAAALGSDPRQRDHALSILEAMRAKDVLISLRGQPGELGRLAERAYHRVMHPVASGASQIE